MSAKRGRLPSFLYNMVVTKKLKYDLKKDKPVSYWALVVLFSGSTILFTTILILSLNSGQERTIFSVGVFAFMAIFSFIWLILMLTRVYERFYGDHRRWFDTWGVAIPNVIIGGLIVAISIYSLVSDGYSAPAAIMGIFGLLWVIASIYAAKKNGKERS